MGLKHIAAVSGGKDSVATLVLAKEFGEPLDAAVYCEVMFDRQTSGEFPEHIEFINSKLRPFVEDQLRIPFVHLRSRKTYLDFFTHIITRGNSVGIVHGFPIPGMCAINRDCKIPPIREYWKSQNDNAMQYVGIAHDESKRLARLNGTNKISLLDKYQVSESEAMKLCESADLLSPIYKITDRNGCWFCMNCKDIEWKYLISKHGHLFDLLVELENSFPIRYRRNLTRNETPSEIKERILKQGEQVRFWEWDR